MADADIENLLVHITSTIGPAGSWPEWRGGWPHEIEACLLDSVFSARAVYGGPETGVRGLVKRWREHEGRDIDDLSLLIEHAVDGRQLAGVLDNHQLVAGRGSARPMKAAAVIDVARRLLAMKVRHAADVRSAADARLDELKAAFTAPKGIGDVTFAYFLMLTGLPGVKADVMVGRFVATALGGRTVKPSSAEDLVIRAAEQLGVEPTKLDHAIWRYMSGRSRARE